MGGYCCPFRASPRSTTRVIITRRKRTDKTGAWDPFRLYVHFLHQHIIFSSSQSQIKKNMKVPQKWSADRIIRPAWKLDWGAEKRLLQIFPSKELHFTITKIHRRAVHVSYCEISSHETCRVSLKTNNLKYVIFNIPGQKCKTAKRDLSGFLLYLLHVLD